MKKLIKCILFIQGIFVVSCANKPENPQPSPVPNQALLTDCERVTWDSVIYRTNSPNFYFTLTETCSSATVLIGGNKINILLPMKKGGTALQVAGKDKIFATRTAGSGTILFYINDMYAKAHLNHGKYVQQ